MKSLYIHGLDSDPNKQKIEIMEQAGLETFALHLDYRLQKNAYQILKSKAIDKNIEFIVGSSLGGYYGFWLAEELGIPCLLLNPAMTIDEKIPFYISNINERNCQFRYVAIGAKDDIIDPIKNKDFFDKIKITKIKQRVIVCKWLAHYNTPPNSDHCLS